MQHLRFLLVLLLSIVFNAFIFAQSNYCIYEEDYFDYVPQTVSIRRKVDKKPKSVWRYLNPKHFLSKEKDEFENKTEMVLEKRKRTFRACCRGFIEIDEKCVTKTTSSSESISKSTTTSSSSSVATQSAPQTVEPTENFIPSTSFQNSSLVYNNVNESSLTVPTVVTPVDSVTKKEAVLTNIAGSSGAESSTVVITESLAPMNDVTLKGVVTNEDTVSDVSVLSNTEDVINFSDTTIIPSRAISITASTIISTTNALNDADVSTRSIMSLSSPISQITLTSNSEDIQYSVPSSKMQPVTSILGSSESSTSFSVSSLEDTPPHLENISVLPSNENVAGLTEIASPSLSLTTVLSSLTISLSVPSETSDDYSKLEFSLNDPTEQPVPLNNRDDSSFTDFIYGNTTAQTSVSSIISTSDTTKENSLQQTTSTHITADSVLLSVVTNAIPIGDVDPTASDTLSNSVTQPTENIIDNENISLYLDSAL